MEGCDSCKKSWEAVHGSNGLLVKPSVIICVSKLSLTFPVVRDGDGSGNSSADDDYNILLHW